MPSGRDAPTRLWRAPVPHFMVKPCSRNWSDADDPPSPLHHKCGWFGGVAIPPAGGYFPAGMALPWEKPWVWIVFDWTYVLTGGLQSEFSTTIVRLATAHYGLMLMLVLCVQSCVHTAKLWWTACLLCKSEWCLSVRCVTEAESWIRGFSNPTSKVVSGKRFMVPKAGAKQSVVK